MHGLTTGTLAHREQHLKVYLSLFVSEERCQSRWLGPGSPSGSPLGDMGVHSRYNTDLFDEATIQRLLGTLPSALETAVAHPEPAGFGTSTADRDHVNMVVEWNETGAEVPIGDH